MINTKASNTILKLNEQTKDDEIIWSIWRSSLDSISGMERLVGNPYKTEVKNKIFRIYKLEERHYTDEEEYEWVPSFRLEFVDNNGKGGWQFPADSRIVDLYETVLFKTSGASDFFDDFLTE